MYAYVTWTNTTFVITNLPKNMIDLTQFPLLLTQLLALRNNKTIQCYSTKRQSLVASDVNNYVIDDF